jgi:hypothetical protein
MAASDHAVLTGDQQSERGNDNVAATDDVANKIKMKTTFNCVPFANANVQTFHGHTHIIG